MAMRWGLTIDCANARVVARFWGEALGYVPAPPPPGFATWEAWLDHYDVPAEERDGFASLHDPWGAGPTLSFLAVPEPKTVKNRLHIDIKAGGGRDAVPWEERWPRVQAEVARLTEAGATPLRTDAIDGRPDHVVMADPEGNEFCVV